MFLSILNLTDSPILVSTTSVSVASDHQHNSIQPSESLEKELPKTCTHRRRARIIFNAILDPKDPLWTTVLNLRCSSVSGLRGLTAWRSVRSSPECPWRLFVFRVDKQRRKLVIFPRRNLASFLSEMPDSLSLASLLLPGTHDTSVQPALSLVNSSLTCFNSLAFYGYPVSQCQSLDTPLAAQLRSGIRVLDVRLAIVKDRLMAYHGVYPQKALFTDVLAIIHAFLTSEEGRRETIVMSIKQEDFTVYPATKFSALVRKEMFESPLGPQLNSEKGADSHGMIYLDNRVPVLGEVRGKLVLFSRFGANGDEWEGGLEGMGIHPLVWPDSSKAGFEWDCHGTTVRTHDWYSIATFLSIPEKVYLSSRILLPPSDNAQPLNITYFSAATFPLALPPTVAKGFGWPNLFGFEGVNTRLGRWLLELFASENDERRYSPAVVGKAKSLYSNTEVGSVVASLLEDTAETIHGWKSEEPKLRGWTFLDYFREPEEGLVALLVESNWRGRKAGEEGWLP